MWETVVELTKAVQETNGDPLTWAIQITSAASAADVSLPSVDIARFLVTLVCREKHVPITWKLLEKAMALNIVPSSLVIALLSTRVIPNRKLNPAAYRLYLELVKRHAFSFQSQINGPDYHKIMECIDGVLHLSRIFGLQLHEPGHIILEFVFSIVWQLLDASLDDEGLLELAPGKKSIWLTETEDMEIDNPDCYGKRLVNSKGLNNSNTIMAIELIGNFLMNNITSKFLYLACQNMPSHWSDFTRRLRVLASNSAALRNSKLMTPDVLLQLASDTCKVLSKATSFGSRVCDVIQCHWISQDSLWLPIDLFLEDVMDGSQVAAASAVENLAGLVKTLQAVNGSTWHVAFLGVWVAALRLVQRERDPCEGPVPRVDTTLCVLLSVTPLAIANLIEEEEGEWNDENKSSSINQPKDSQAPGKRREGLITSLQQLSDYDALLAAPHSIQTTANQAAAKAAMFVSGLTNANGYPESISTNDMPVSCRGNLHHLIVEACIARNMLDTSSYHWPGYVNLQTNKVPSDVRYSNSCWSSLMKGSPLTPSLTNALVMTPASSLTEIEKIYEIATTGSNDEKIAAATILCGASLVRGWSIQEHVILFIVRLLLVPAPADYSGTYDYLIDHASFLNVLLIGISPVDCVQMCSLHGMVPLLAGALMPICEAFGSSVPNIKWTLPTGEEFCSHAVFSNAFTLLLRLWRFDQPPLDHVMKDVPSVGAQLSPELLLLVRNSRLASFGKSPKDRMARKRFSKLLTFPSEPVFVDSFPKLKRWNRQHQECIASTLSALDEDSPVHKVVDSLLNMMFRKTNKNTNQAFSTPPSSGSSVSASGADDVSARLKIPGWDILEATPFALDAALTACAHKQLSPRELATGLKDLADLLPASLGTIVSYFSAEVTRGVWKPVCMNGTDWPSPAANLASIEQQIKKILAATGVVVPSLTVGSDSPATLPLPLAALVSLTITYKLDKATERSLVLVAPALSALAASCPWPCMPIISSLWAQKVKRWNDFLAFSASSTVFHHNRDAVVQLLKSCFTSTLGPTRSWSNGGVGSLLGHGFGSHHYGGISPVAPAILYLRVHRSVRDVMFLTEEILSILISSVDDIALEMLQADKLKKRKRGMMYGNVSLASAMKRVKLAASLGASLVWISGGLNLVQSLIKETLPSWFLSVQNAEKGESQSMVSMLRGRALAYFAVLCGAFAWGVDSTSPASKRRPNVLGSHMEFLVSAVEGKISLGCDDATWRAYVSGFVSLVLGCTPGWVLEVDVEVVKRLSRGLRMLRLQDLALSLIAAGGVSTMGAAVELILEASATVL